MERDLKYGQNDKTSAASSAKRFIQKRRDGNHTESTDTIKEGLEYFYLKSEKIKKIERIFNFNNRTKGNSKCCVYCGVFFSVMLNSFQ